MTNDDELLKKLKESWENMETAKVEETIVIKNSIHDPYIPDKRICFFDFINKILIERKEDFKQIETSEELYNKILYNFNKGKKIGSLNAWSFKEIIGKDFCILFKDDVKGLSCSEITFKINGIPYQTKGIVIGLNVFNANKHNPMQFWISFKEYIIHELVHFNDKLRSKIVVSTDTTKPTEYYNSPFEFNAYFIQFAKHFYELVKNGTTLNKFGTNHQEFLDYFWNEVKIKQPDLKKSLTKQMLFKWNKRIYQLYDHLKEL